MFFAGTPGQQIGRRAPDHLFTWNSQPRQQTVVAERDRAGLVQQQRQQINREQNNASRQIYNDNHNGNTVAPNAVNNREANQQARTAQGLRNGQLNAGEAARTDQRQANIDRQVHNDRAANGGALNQQERQQVNREQNRSSQQIQQERHNAPAARPEGGRRRTRS